MMALATRLFGNSHRKQVKRVKPAKPADRAQDQCEEIARLAYQLYEERGREDGHATDDWLKAEAIVKQRAGAS